MKLNALSIWTTVPCQVGGLMYYWLWPNTLQSGPWKVKAIRFDLSAGSCARFGQGNRRSEGETEAKETCVTSVIQ